VTNRELIAEIRKPGAVCVPVLVPADVVYIEARKSDLIAHLSQYEASDTASWDISTHNGQKYLDARDETF
jgi:hypothetical protein